jgi:hypothetical protein
MTQPTLVTVSVFRRHYGRRYTDLPVEQVSADGFSINCGGTYMRPQHYDLRAGDIVRWRDGERFVEAEIRAVHRTDDAVHAELTNAYLLPPEFFPY